MRKIETLLLCVGILTASIGTMIAAAPADIYRYEEPETEVIAEVEVLSVYIPETVGVSVPMFELVEEQPEHEVPERYSETEETMQTEEETTLWISVEETEITAPSYFIAYDGNSLSEASVRSLANYICGQYGVDPDIVVAMSWIESRWTPSVTSPHGAVGLCQVIPKWHYARMARLGVDNLYDPYSCMLVSVDLIHELQQYPNGDDIRWVLMAYNEGVDAANWKYNQGIISDYVRDIFARMEELQ